eukprot:m.100170 g.100170  ORF g.100170 m.100170 type:complete len:106 (+) comp15379_c0_seq1:3765-4082(+)
MQKRGGSLPIFHVDFYTENGQQALHHLPAILLRGSIVQCRQFIEAVCRVHISFVLHKQLGAARLRVLTARSRGVLPKSSTGFTAMPGTASSHSIMSGPSPQEAAW